MVRRPRRSDSVETTHALRVLIANERADRLALLADVVGRLGHEVVVSEVKVGDVGAATARERPDIALVGLGESSDHALDMISAIVRQAYCPVIALLASYDSEFVNQAALRGVFAYIVDSRPEEIQSAIDITLRRYIEYARLQGAFDRRNADEERKAELTRIQQRQVLELHDGVVQQLAVAQIALQLDQREKSRDALLAALENARAVVSRSLVDLQSEGIPLAQLIKDAAAG
jgi:AmiR/NasT family two-component response regulator